MTLVATARSNVGTLRQDVLVDGRFRLTTDEPEHLGGTDRAPSPHELLPAAIASCVSTTILMYARTKGWELGAVQVDAEYDPGAEPVSCDLVIRTEQQLTEEQLLRLEKVASTCPVRRVLDGTVVFGERIVPGTVLPALRPAV
jgi:putative redox protein